MSWHIQDFVHHWKYYLPPARASPSDLRFIKKKILEKGKGVKVLILGSTPEYRNLCGELNIPVTLLDFSRYNYDYLTAEVKNMPKEIFHEGDWLTTVLQKKFDIVLGDNIINVCKKENLHVLLTNIAKMLKLDGFFMPRVYVREKGESYTGEKVIKEYKEKRKGQTFYEGTIRNMYLAAYNLKKDMLHLHDVWILVEDLHKKRIINDKELQCYKRMCLKDNTFQFFIPLREALEKSFSTLFEIQEVFHGTEPFLQDKLPLYTLARKESK